MRNSRISGLSCTRWVASDPEHENLKKEEVRCVGSGWFKCAMHNSQSGPSLALGGQSL